VAIVTATGARTTTTATAARTAASRLPKRRNLRRRRVSKLFYDDLKERTSPRRDVEIYCKPIRRAIREFQAAEGLPTTNTAGKVRKPTRWRTLTSQDLEVTTAKCFFVMHRRLESALNCTRAPNFSLARDGYANAGWCLPVDAYGDGRNHSLNIKLISCENSTLSTYSSGLRRVARSISMFSSVKGTACAVGIRPGSII
jgi:hypothetical protein